MFVLIHDWNGEDSHDTSFLLGFITKLYGFTAGFHPLDKILKSVYPSNSPTDQNMYSSLLKVCRAPNLSHTTFNK